MISGEKPKDVNWSSHRSGQAHLLRLRGEQQFATERGRSLFRLINSQLLYGDFVFWAETPLGIPDWPDDLYFTELGTSVMKLHRRIAETRRKTHEMLKEASSSSPPSKEQAEMLTEAAQRCLALDAEIQQRIDWVQPAFGPKTLSVPSSEESDGESSHSGSESSSRRRNAPSGERSFPAEIFVYHNVLTAISWNAIYCARIKLLMDVLTVNHYLCNNNFPPAPLFASNYIPTTLISAADFICNSVPCVFGDIDPEGKINLSPQPKMIGVMSLVWTLYSVSTIPGIEKRRIQWIKDQFLRAGTVAGLKHALNVAKLLPKT